MPDEVIEAVEVVASHPVLYPTDPADMVRVATNQAETLAEVIEDRQLYSMLKTRDGMKKHINVAGWTLLGAMAGVFPVTEWSRQITVTRADGSQAEGWEARCIVRHLASGEIVGAAEGMCLRSEKVWSQRDDYALRSMAETRARSKALRAPLEFVVNLAGFHGTPDEEMPGVDSATEGQYDSLRAIVEELRGLDEDDEVRVNARAEWAKVTGSAGTFPTTYADAETLLNGLAELGLVPGSEPF